MRIFFIALCILSGLVSGAQRLLTLEEAISVSLSNNYDIRLSRNDSALAALDYAFANYALYPRLNATGGIQFIIEPHVRFKCLPGEQATMFLLDPSGNALEFKAFQDVQKQLFEV